MCLVGDGERQAAAPPVACMCRAVLDVGRGFLGLGYPGDVQVPQFPVGCGCTQPVGMFQRQRLQACPPCRWAGVTKRGEIAVIQGQLMAQSPSPSFTASLDFWWLRPLRARSRPAPPPPPPLPLPLLLEPLFPSLKMSIPPLVPGHHLQSTHHEAHPLRHTLHHQFLPAPIFDLPHRW